MRQNALLRFMLACFLLYIAWPSFDGYSVGIESLFWGAWLTFFFLVAGANLAIILRVLPKVQLTGEGNKARVYGKN